MTANVVWYSMLFFLEHFYPLWKWKLTHTNLACTVPLQWKLFSLCTETVFPHVYSAQGLFKPSLDHSGVSRSALRNTKKTSIYSIKYFYNRNGAEDGDPDHCSICLQPSVLWYPAVIFSTHKLSHSFLH